MRIYTGQTSGEKLKPILQLKMGVMISSSPTSSPSKELNETYCALDNGAFSCYKKGYPFMADIFIKTLNSCFKNNTYLDFIVCPDIIAGGLDSLAFSLEWTNSKLLRTAPRLALVLQDGMKPKHLGSLNRFTHLFVGGSVEWKWKTAPEWTNFAHDNGKQLHIGQCGKIESLLRAYEIGADSVDSVSFTRNNKFSIVSEFYDKIGVYSDYQQPELFP